MSEEEIALIAEIEYTQSCRGCRSDNYGNIRPSWQNLPSNLKSFYCRLVASGASAIAPPVEDE